MTQALSLPPDDMALHEFHLTPNDETVIEVQGPARSSYQAAELIVHAASDAVYFRWNDTSRASVRGSDCDVFPAVIGSVQLKVPGYGQFSNRLRIITAGTATLSLVRR